MGVSHPPVGYAGAPMPFACLFPPAAYLATVVTRLRRSCFMLSLSAVPSYVRYALYAPARLSNAIAFLDTFQLCVIRPHCYQKLYTLGLYTRRPEEGAVVWHSAG